MKTKKLDLLLINPGDRNEIYQSLGSTGISAVEPPVWVGLMASYMLAKGYSVEIIDANAEGLLPREVAERIRDADPVLTAVVVYGHNPSASTQVMPSAGRICSEIKKLNPVQKIIMVGGHVAALPQRTLKEEAVDFVCTGEGPITLAELVQCLKETGLVAKPKVRGLMYWDNDTIFTTASVPNISNLDEEMPGIPWHLLPMNRYRTFNWHGLGYPTRKPSASIYTTLGCPYKCEFCCIQAPFKEGERMIGLKPGVNSYRFWSPEHIVKEIKLLVENYGVKYLKFADEMYFLNARHNNAISKGLIREGLGDWLDIWSYARVDTVKNEEMIDLARQSGMRWFCLGIESASERVRGDINKGYRQEDIFNCIEKSRRVGISIIANFIAGLPEDNMETMKENLDMALELNTEWFTIYSAMAYPGSELYRRALREGWRLPDSWIGYSQHSEETLPLPTKHLTGGQVLAFRDYAHKRYFTNPNYLAMIEKKFGPLAVKTVDEMMANNLTRKHAEPIQELA